VEFVLGDICITDKENGRNNRIPNGYILWRNNKREVDHRERRAWMRYSIF
jgi:ribosomal protein L39E